MVRKIILITLAAISALSCLVGIVFFIFWIGQRNLPFNEEGRYFDSIHSVVYEDYTDIYKVIIFFSVVVFVGSLGIMRRVLKRK